MPAVRRMRLHRQVGEALENLYRSDIDAHLTELAHHFQKAVPLGEVGLAVDYLRRAGEQAMAVLAYEEAANHFEGALKASETQDSRELQQQCTLLLARYSDTYRGRVRALRPSKNCVGHNPSRRGRRS